MIVEFSVKNFRSIKDLQTISFAATGLKSAPENAQVDVNNIVEGGGIRLLKTVGVYGANASGKSNIIKALDYFVWAIGNSPSQESRLSNLCDPFLYQEDAENTESFFQIVCMLEGKKYRYGFTVKRNPHFSVSLQNSLSKEIITSEWLYGTKDSNVGKYFIRKGLEVDKETLPDKESIPPLQYDHTLFLSHAAAFIKDSIISKVRQKIFSASLSNVFDNNIFRQLSILDISDGPFSSKNDFLHLLSAFNLKYDDITFEKDAGVKEEYEVPLDKIFLYKHNKRGNSRIKLNLQYNESAGTQKLFDMAGLILMAFTTQLFIFLDEIDSNFHPSLLIKLIELFNDPSINKANSQLLFTSHDTNLLDPKIMRRDQFYFTEKNEDESTRVYSLADLKGIRNDADFARDYLRGIYGAIPILETYSQTK